MIEQETTKLEPVRELRPREVAELLMVDRTTIWRWVRRGRFGKVRRGGLGATSPNKISYDSVREVASQLGIELSD